MRALCRQRHSSRTLVYLGLTLTSVSDWGFESKLSLSDHIAKVKGDGSSCGREKIEFTLKHFTGIAVDLSSYRFKS